MQFVLESLDLAGSAIATATSDDPFLPGLLGACGVALLDLSEGDNARSALDMSVDFLRAAKDAISAWGQVEPLDSGTWVFILQTLTEALRRRFEATGNEQDIIEAEVVFGSDEFDTNMLSRELLTSVVTRLRVFHSKWRLQPDGDSLESLIGEYSQAKQYLILNHRNPIRAELSQATDAALNEMFFDPKHQRGEAFASILSGYQAGEELLATWQHEGVAPDLHSPGFAPYLFAMGRAWELQFHGTNWPEALGTAHTMYSECLALTDPKSSHYALRAAAVISTQRMKRGLAFAGDNTETDEFAISILKKVLLGNFPLERRAAAAVATELGYIAFHQYDPSHPRTSARLDQAIQHFRKAVVLSNTDKISELKAMRTLADVLTTRAKENLERGLKDLAEADCKEVLGMVDTIAWSKLPFVNLPERRDTLGDVNKVLFRIHRDEK